MILQNSVRSEDHVAATSSGNVATASHFANDLLDLGLQSGHTVVLLFGLFQRDNGVFRVLSDGTRA